MKPYTPQANSAIGRICAFFATNPDEELTPVDISAKFGVSRAGVHTLLSPALQAALLTRRRDDDGEYFYGKGPEASSPAKPSSSSVDIDKVHRPKQPPTQPPTHQPAHQPSFSAPRQHLDLDQLVVETHVPYLPDGMPGSDKWAPLFDKLGKPGHSVAVPAHVKSALTAAAAKRNKAAGKVHFRVAKTGPEQARVWRVA